MIMKTILDSYSVETVYGCCFHNISLSAYSSHIFLLGIKCVDCVLHKKKKGVIAEI